MKSASHLKSHSLVMRSVLSGVASFFVLSALVAGRPDVAVAEALQHDAVKAEKSGHVLLLADQQKTGSITTKAKPRCMPRKPCTLPVNNANANPGEEP